MSADPTTGIPVPEAAATGIPRAATGIPRQAPAAEPVTPEPPGGEPQDEQPAEEQPQDEQPAEEQPQDEEPADEEPAEEQPQDEEPAAAKPAGPPPLGERERRILAFERQWWRHAGAKEQAIRDAFGLSATRYYQLLNSLLDEPAAQAHDPVLVGRLRRLRAARSRSRRR